VWSSSSRLLSIHDLIFFLSPNPKPTPSARARRPPFRATRPACATLATPRPLGKGCDAVKTRESTNTLMNGAVRTCVLLHLESEEGVAVAAGRLSGGRALCAPRSISLHPRAPPPPRSLALTNRNPTVSLAVPFIAPHASSHSSSTNLENPRVGRREPPTTNCSRAPAATHSPSIAARKTARAMMRQQYHGMLARGRRPAAAAPARGATTGPASSLPTTTTTRARAPSPALAPSRRSGSVRRPTSLFAAASGREPSSARRPPGLVALKYA
jgi:hypothetical protein